MQPNIKLQRPTETRWPSHLKAIDHLRRYLKPVVALLEKEATEGDATALGLAIQI